MVVFFPSYAYLDKCTNLWRTSSKYRPRNGTSIWNSLHEIKPTFREANSAESQSDHLLSAQPKTKRVEETLKAYSEAISRGRGAMMLAVMGGSLSEGINFSDELGRGIVVVGLPFPNPKSAEWKAKMEYISKKSALKSAKSQPAREFYENACMRVVNQCIGRAIRHKNDYAAIILLDERYSQLRINGKLPKWIRTKLSTYSNTDMALKTLKSFFNEKNAAAKS